MINTKHILGKLFNLKPICKHEFKLGNLKKTNIPEPEIAKDADYTQAVEYWKNYWDHDFIKKRVAWSCSKCGKVFYAHCGLDILSKGKIIHD